MRLINRSWPAMRRAQLLNARCSCPRCSLAMPEINWTWKPKSFPWPMLSLRGTTDDGRKSGRVDGDQNRGSNGEHCQLEVIVNAKSQIQKCKHTGQDPVYSRITDIATDLSDHERRFCKSPLENRLKKRACNRNKRSITADWRRAVMPVSVRIRIVLCEYESAAWAKPSQRVQRQAGKGGRRWHQE